jgi:hypothetical protein
MERRLVVDRAGDDDRGRPDSVLRVLQGLGSLACRGLPLPDHGPRFVAAKPLGDHAAGDMGFGAEVLRDLVR